MHRLWDFLICQTNRRYRKTLFKYSSLVNHSVLKSKLKFSSSLMSGGILANIFTADFDQVNAMSDFKA